MIPTRPQEDPKPISTHQSSKELSLRLKTILSIFKTIIIINFSEMWSIYMKWSWRRGSGSHDSVGVFIVTLVAHGNPVTEADVKKHA